MAIKIDPRENCRHCGAPMDARMIQSARLIYGDRTTDVFSRTLPAFICPKCDGPDDSKHRVTGPPTRR
jgi:hypothetical protein